MGQHLVVLPGKETEEHGKQKATGRAVQQDPDYYCQGDTDPEGELDATGTKGSLEDLSSIEGIDWNEVQHGPEQAYIDEIEQKQVEDGWPGALARCHQEKNRDAAGSLQDRACEADQDILPAGELAPLVSRFSTHAVKNDGHLPAAESAHCQGMAQFVDQDGEKARHHEEENVKQRFPVVELQESAGE